MTSRSGLLALLGAVAALVLGGCGGGYVLRGRAVEGEWPSLDFVPATSPELEAKGLVGVSLSVYRDPDNLNQHLVATGRTDRAGDFSIPLDVFGAGWMEERWRVIAVRGGLETADGILVLPGAGADRRLLIVLSPGVSIEPREPEHLWQEFEKYR